MAENTQSFKSHTKLDPAFHFFLGPVGLALLIVTIVELVRDPGWTTGWHVVAMLWALIAVFKIRLYSLRVQDRVIRLEERLRLQALLSEPLRSRIGELTESQLIGLRFASDGEVAALVGKTLAGKLKQKEIMKSAVLALVAAVLALAATLLAGCNINMEHGGPPQHLTQSIELGKAEMVNVELKMGAGELRVEGGSPKLMDADFTYNLSSWKPIVHYESSSFRGTLTVEQPKGFSAGPNVNYKWDLRLNNDVPLDVVAHLGAGEARMDLSHLTLRGVEVHMGVGELRLDLRGSPKRDYDVEVHGGIGEATIYLPTDVSVDAKASGGIGNISGRGLEKRDDHWVNPNKMHAPVTVHMDVHGGIGNITMIAE
jgi:hypothetical protein